MLSLILLSILSAFDLSVAQNSNFNGLKAGGSITFDLYNQNGGTVPATTEAFSVTLLDGSGNMDNAKTISTLKSGVTQTKGITVQLPGDLAAGKYFLGLVAASGTKYSGLFDVSGGSSTKSGNAPNDSSNSSNSGDSSNNSTTDGNTKNSDSASSANLLVSAVALSIIAAINIF
eukprot:NODE_1255_length_1599_cov_0.450000.p1 type:complete len:174 gc:universal NODE_1255_length_1599_cov_0.450000:1028-507(-)